MAFAQGSRNQLQRVKEGTFGTIPSNPSGTIIPINTHSLNLSKDRVQSQELRSDRMRRVDRHGNRRVVGDIVGELRPDDFDAELESAFFNTFDTNNVLTIGTTEQFYTYEDGQLDIGQYREFNGCAVSRMRLQVRPNEMVIATFSMVGQQGDIDQTSFDANPSQPTDAAPFDSYSGSINLNGSSIALITGIDFTLDNALNPTFVVGSDTTPQLEYGLAAVEGQFTAYFEDATLIDLFINETESDLDFTLDDPTSGNTYTFTFPRIKVNAADVPTDSPTSRIITLPFVALYDSSEGTNLKLAKS